MNFDTFFEKAQSTALTLPLPNRSHQHSGNLLDNEALFQLPLICIIILMIAKDRRKPNVAELGQIVGECIESSFIGFKGSAQHVGWSANLRIRTVKALSFLEQVELIVIHNRKDKLYITDLGRKVVDRAMEWDELLEYNLTLVSRAYRNICISRQLSLELE